MAQKHDEDLFGLLRARGVRKGLARSLAALEGNRRRAGAKGERLAREAADDLTAAADEIRKRVLRSDPKRSQGARKAARTRGRNASKRAASAKKAAATRAKSARTRTKTGARKG